MRVLKHAIIGLLIFTLVFLFLPTGQDGNAVVDNFQATTSYATSFKTTSAQLVSPYVVTGELGPDSDMAKSVQTAMASAQLAEYILEVVPYSDVYSPGEMRPVAPPSSEFGKWRSWTTPPAYHAGSDFSCSPSAGAGNGVWFHALFSGNVVLSYYHSSWGRMVVIESDTMPGLYIRYCHMGPGNASLYGGKCNKPYKYENGEKPTSGGSRPSDWEKSQGYTAYNSESATWAGGSVQLKVGDHVNVGDRIGMVGTTGSSTGNHAHIELGVYIGTTGVVQKIPDRTDPGRKNSYLCDAHDVLMNHNFDTCIWVNFVNTKSKSGKRELTKADLEYFYKNNPFGEEEEEDAYVGSCDLMDGGEG